MMKTKEQQYVEAMLEEMREQFDFTEEEEKDLAESIRQEYRNLPKEEK